jgi:molybdate transport system substrate-binding protein
MLTNSAFSASADEIKVMAGSVLSTVIGQLGPQFKPATGTKLAMQYGLSRMFKRQIDAGVAFDLVILSVETVDQLIKERKVVAASRTDIARTGLGIAVRKGAPRPDISSVEAFKKTLLAANSISWAPKTETGEHLSKVFERLGLQEEIMIRSRSQQAVERVAMAVANGEAEIAITVTSLLITPGVELVGPIPSELQTYLTFTAAVGVTAKHPEGSFALIRHLTSQNAHKEYTVRGWEASTK